MNYVSKNIYLHQNTTPNEVISVHLNIAYYHSELQLSLIYGYSAQELSKCE